MRKHQNQKIQERKSTEKPIEYSNLSINERGKLKSSLLDQRVVEGYGLIWGSVNSHGEIFAKGCCAKSIKDIGPNSNSSYQLKLRDEHGRACALFEELKEDDIGLYFKTKQLDNVQWCDDLLVQLRSGTINNFSIGFKHMWDKVEWDEENNAMVCLEIKLMEISSVTIPSDENTYALRSAENKEELFEDVEDFIISLPKHRQLETRKLITRCLSLSEVEPQLTKEVIALRTRKKADEEKVSIYTRLLNEF